MQEKNTNNKIQRKHMPLRYTKDSKCITSKKPYNTTFNIQHNIHTSSEMTTAPKMTKSYSTIAKTIPTMQFTNDYNNNDTMTI